RVVPLMFAHVTPRVQPCLLLLTLSFFSSFFFFNDPATTEIYTLSLHDALPIFLLGWTVERIQLPHTARLAARVEGKSSLARLGLDRKSTRLNSSHDQISYAVFCLKKKKKYKLMILHAKHTPAI